MSLTKEISEYKVSSILNGDRKMYGKKFLFDGNDETCWNSDQGAPQWIEISFKETKTINKLVVQFQGGFASKELRIEKLSPKSDQDLNIEDLKSYSFHPLDINQTQEFVFDDPLEAQRIRLVLNSSFDFYGRIIIYNLDLLGS